MSFLDQHKKISEMASRQSLEPSPELWQRVEQKLAHHKRKKGHRAFRRLYFVSAIAASFLLLVAFFSLIYWESRSPQLVEKGKVESMEVLEADSDYFYSVEDVRLSYRYYNHQAGQVH